MIFRPRGAPGRLAVQTSSQFPLTYTWLAHATIVTTAPSNLPACYLPSPSTMLGIGVVKGRIAGGFVPAARFALHPLRFLAVGWKRRLGGPSNLPYPHQLAILAFGFDHLGALTKNFQSYSRCALPPWRVTASVGGRQEMRTRRVICPLFSQKVLLLARKGSSGAGCMLPSTSNARDVIWCSPGAGVPQSNVQNRQA